jgi:hypothetical protein
LALISVIAAALSAYMPEVSPGKKLKIAPSPRSAGRCCRGALSYGEQDVAVQEVDRAGATDQRVAAAGAGLGR